MRGFEISEPGRSLIEAYPSAEALRTVALAMPMSERDHVLRLWLSEGIPSAFRATPSIFEAVRGWLGAKLNVHPKTITLIGSARMGYSVSPHPDYGRPFGPTSDLDLTVISEPLFARLVADFGCWRSDYREGQVPATE